MRPLAVHRRRSTSPVTAAAATSASAYPAKSAPDTALGTPLPSTTIGKNGSRNEYVVYSSVITANSAAARAACTVVVGSTGAHVRAAVLPSSRTCASCPLRHQLPWRAYPLLAALSAVAVGGGGCAAAHRGAAASTSTNASSAAAASSARSTCSIPV